MTPDHATLKSPSTASPVVPNTLFSQRNAIPFPVAVPEFPAVDPNPPNRRKFIIFDHTGNHTTFMFSSVAPPALHLPTSSSIHSNPPGASTLSRKEAATGDEEDADDIDVLLDSDSDESEADFLFHPNSPREEEVASSGGPTKRVRPASEEDTASSMEEKDAKRARRERIEEAVCVLRKIIPGCGGKADAMVVLDEAIRYLKSLESKATALGIAL